MLTPPRKVQTTPFRNNQSTAMTKSAYTSPERSAAKFSNIKEIPLDPQSRYTISYVPGMSEHEIDTGKTFEDAKMKIVLLTCELERINSFNYTLVRENEVLRVQADKSEREKDLETKLAIVIAENEKLNQVIEDIYEVYMSRRDVGSGSNEEYEQRISQLYRDLDDWKQKVNVLENQNNIVELQNQVNELQNERNLLSEKLTRKDRDLEVLRARITSVDESSLDKNQSAQKNAELNAEIIALKTELDAMKLKYGNADSLQLKISDYQSKIKSILVENERLNVALLDKTKEAKELKDKLDNQGLKKSKVTEVSINLANDHGESQKRAGVNDSSKIVQELTTENLKLKQENDKFKIQLATSQSFDNKNAKQLEENKKLAARITELEKELASSKALVNQAKESKAQLEKLKGQIQELIQQNEKLNLVVLKNQSQNADSNSLKEEIKTLKARLAEKEKEAQDGKLALEKLTLKIQELIQQNEKLNSVALKQSNTQSQSQKDELARLRYLLEEKQREIDDILERFSDAHRQSFLLEEYKEKVILISQENERLNNLVHEKFAEVDALQRKILILETQTIKPEAYEERIRVLLTENQRLTESFKDKANEVDALKRRSLDNQSNPGHVADLMSKISLISVENDRLNNELQSLKFKFNDLANEKNKYELVLSEKNREVEYLRSSNVRVVESDVSHLNIENESLKNAGAEQRRKIGELEGRLAQLTSLETKVNYLTIEVDRLQDEIRHRDSNIQILTQRIYEKDTELDELKRKSYSSVSEHERKLTIIQAELEQQISRLGAEKRVLEDKVRLLEAQQRDLNGEVEEWKRRYLQLEASKTNEEEIEDLRKQFANLQSLNIQIKDFQMKFEAERTAYETQILQMEQRISDLESETAILRDENEKLANISVQRFREIQELRLNSNEETHKLEVLELRRHIELLKSQSYDVKKLAIQHSSERASDQAKISELQHVNTALKLEVQKLEELLEQRKEDLESLTHQIEDLRKICQKLQGERKSVDSPLDNLESLKLKISELELQRNEYKRQAERNSLDLTRKNRELVEKIQEVEIVKLKYEEALANYQALNNQIFNRLSVRS